MEKIKIGVFINTDTVKNLKFTQCRIVSELGYYAEIDTLRGFMQICLYTKAINSELSFDENIQKIKRSSAIVKTTTEQELTIAHINIAANYITENAPFSIHYFLIDTYSSSLSAELMDFLRSSDFYISERLAKIKKQTVKHSTIKITH